MRCRNGAPAKLVLVPQLDIAMPSITSRSAFDIAARIAASVLLSLSAAAQTTAPQWFQTFDGPANYDDNAAGVAVDSAGNVYTAGNVYVSPPGQGGVLVPQIATLKYSPSGQLLWSRQWGTGYYGGNGVAAKIALAPNGRVIVAGQRDLGEDWVVLAYAPDGTLVFETLWLADSWFVSSPSDIAIDAASNVFLCGDYGDPFSGAERAALIEVDASGALAWARTYDGAGSSIGTVSSLALGPGGAIYLTGGSDGPNAGLEFSVARVDANGVPVWRKNHWTLDFYAYNYGVDVAVAPSGAVIATGTIDSNSGSGSGISTIAYDAAGTQLWRYDYNPTFQLSEYASAMALDASGNVYVAGFDDPPGTNFNALLVKLTANGQFAWVRSFGAAGSTREVRVDGFGHVLFATQVPGASTPIAIRGYDALGGLLGTTTWDGPNTSSAIRLADFALAPGGAPVIACTAYSGAATGDDVLTASFSTGGGSVVTHSYCTGKLNSAGCTPSSAWSGTPSASSSAPFVVSATQVVNQKNGLFFYGTSGPAAAPFAGGTICVAQPVRRTPVSSSGGSTALNDCSGVLSFDFNAWIDAGFDPALVAGSIVDGQFWYRDPQSASFVGLSNGVEFRVEP